MVWKYTFLHDCLFKRKENTHLKVFDRKSSVIDSQDTDNSSIEAPHNESPSETGRDEEDSNR